MQRCRRRTGAFSVYPSTDRDGKISAWRGRTEVALESRDFAAASKLAGQLSNLMQVANVEFSLSPEAQRAAEQKLTTEAIKSFRARADEAAKAFGYGSYDPRRERRRRPQCTAVPAHDGDGRGADGQREDERADRGRRRQGHRVGHRQRLRADEVTRSAAHGSRKRRPEGRRFALTCSADARADRTCIDIASRSGMRGGDTPRPSARRPRGSSAATATAPSTGRARAGRGSRRPRANSTVKRARP